MTIIITRLRKTLIIFQQKTRVTKHFIMRLRIRQIFTVILSVAVNLAVYVVAFSKNKPTLLSRRTDKLELVIQCNTDLYFNSSLVYLMFLYIYCLLQAFQGRKLPGLFYEPITMVYLCFIQILSFGIYFPIYLSPQNDSVDRTAIQWTLLSLHSLFSIIFLFSKKAYVFVG